jgi:truncated hemoglobin YjbI
MNAQAIISTESTVGLGDENLIGSIVDVFYQNMLDDYRINRFFYTRPVSEQTKPLKLYLKTLLGSGRVEPSKLSELLDSYFTAAFARGNAKPSLVNNADFAFLEMVVSLDVFKEDEVIRITCLTPAHSHLIRLKPDDDNYDVALENLANALAQLKISDKMATQIMAFAESGRDGVLGRGKEIYISED